MDNNWKHFIKIRLPHRPRLPDNLHKSHTCYSRKLADPVGKHTWESILEDTHAGFHHVDSHKFWCRLGLGPSKLVDKQRVDLVEKKCGIFEKTNKKSNRSDWISETQFPSKNATLYTGISHRWLSPNKFHYWYTFPRSQSVRSATWWYYALAYLWNTSSHLDKYHRSSIHNVSPSLAKHHRFVSLRRPRNWCTFLLANTGCFRKNVAKSAENSWKE